MFLNLELQTTLKKYMHYNGIKTKKNKI